MTAFPYKIREIQAKTDSEEISQLVRESFLQWLDYDNLNYLDRLRKAGIFAGEHPLWTGLTGFPFEIRGVVCTNEKSKIIGVISTYSFRLNESRCSLAANVCVAQEYRRKGVALHMIREVERRQKADGVTGIFLQARMEKPDVTVFYRKEGFRVTDFRETWIYPLKRKAVDKNVSGYKLEYVPQNDRNNFTERFRIRYPASILWNLDYRQDLFGFGLSGEIFSRLTSPAKWFRRVIGPDGQVRLWAACQKLNGPLDILWMVPNRNVFAEELKNSLIFLTESIRFTKPVRMDIPAEIIPEAYSAAGFVRLQRLAWMWKKL